MLRKGFCAGGLAVLAVVLAAGAAEAQDRQRGGFGRGGGFGGDGGSVAGLLRIEEVRNEIGVTDEQQRQLREALASARPERPDVNFRELSDEERREYFTRMREQRAKSAAEAEAKVKEVLNEKQVQRLEQISLQNRGARALLDDQVAEKLGISDEQKEEIRSVLRENRESMREQMREAFQGQDRENVDRAAVREKMEQLRTQADEKVLAVLSADQKEQYQQMKGEAFEMPQRRFGGRRGDRNDADRGDRPRRGRRGADRD